MSCFGFFSAAALSLSAEPKTVFAHYMTCFGNSVGGYEREIKLAQQYGIDGFALNCGEWQKTKKDGSLLDSRYVGNADRLLWIFVKVFENPAHGQSDVPAFEESGVCVVCLDPGVQKLRKPLFYNVSPSSPKNSGRTKRHNGNIKHVSP